MSQEFPCEATSAVSWAVPPGKPDPIFGPGATRAEKGVANIVGLVGAVGITALTLRSERTRLGAGHSMFLPSSSRSMWSAASSPTA